VARDTAAQARTAPINELKALVVTADDTLRAELRGLRTPALIKTLQWVPPRQQPVPQRAMRPGRDTSRGPQDHPPRR
jgi:hypothetical protein